MVESGETPGFPRFESEYRLKTLEFSSCGDGCGLKDDGRIYIQHVGHIKVKVHRSVDGRKTLVWL